MDSANYVIAFQRDRLGDGDEELGKLLIKAFINTLADTPVKPAVLVFLNAGIFFTLKDSPVLDALKKLEQSGVKLLICGTCLNYFQKKEELAVGEVSNMIDIVATLSKAGHVLYP